MEETTRVGSYRVNVNIGISISQFKQGNFYLFMYWYKISQYLYEQRAGNWNDYNVWYTWSNKTKAKVR